MGGRDHSPYGDDRGGHCRRARDLLDSVPGPREREKNTRRAGPDGPCRARGDRLSQRGAQKGEKGEKTAWGGHPLWEMIALLLQQMGGDGGVDAARHPDDDLRAHAWLTKSSGKRRPAR